MLFAPVVIKATPLLTLLALIMWVSQVVTSFPPGAINVETAVKEHYEILSVPSFDLSFVSSSIVHKYKYDFVLIYAL